MQHTGVDSGCRARRQVAARWGVLAWLALLGVAGTAQAERAYTPGVVAEQFAIRFVVNADGSYLQTVQELQRVEAPQGIAVAGTQQIGYSGSQEEVESIEAWTQRPDGQRIVVPAADIHVRDESNEEGASEFSDRKFRVIVFPQVEVGSRVFYRAQIRRRVADYPGQVSLSFTFSPRWQWDEVTVEVSMPQGMALHVQQRVVTGGRVSASQGRDLYHFHYHGGPPVAPESEAVSASDFAPILRLSTFPDVVAMGRAYEGTLAPKVVVTPALEEQARLITRGLQGEAARARAIHNWVSHNIRYVAVFLGSGGLIPHSAEEVLAKRYGDCKDHAALMQALLSAVGIGSSAALINLGSAYNEPEVGTLGPYNHVITYLPDIDLYVDSTAQFAPFGTLPFADMDKPTVLTGLARTGHTPVLQAADNLLHTTLKLQVREDGTIHGSGRSHLTGPAEIDSRSSRFDAQGTPEEQDVASLLERFSETGTGSLRHTGPEDLESPYWIESTFTLDPLVNIPGRGALAVPVGLQPGMLGILAASRPSEKVLQPYACEAQTVQEDYEISFAPNIVLGEIPAEVLFEQGGLRYAAHYERQGQQVRVARTLTENRPGSVCGPRDHAAWQALHAVLRRDLRAQIFYSADATPLAAH
jgi:transglutaminase-like putative cysteine protease